MSNVNTLILKKPDGTIVRTTGKEAADKLEEVTGMSAMVIEAMFGGIPVTTQEGQFVIEQSEHPEMVEDFLKSKSNKSDHVCTSDCRRDGCVICEHNIHEGDYCDICDRPATKNICPTHGDHHEFIKSDEWGETCVCGEPKP